MKPIKIFWKGWCSILTIDCWNHYALIGQVPNPAKVLVILEELGLPYQSELVNSEDVKTRRFLDINPNGRLPAIIDPNNNSITLWESGAIVLYLIATYDKSSTLTYTSSPEKLHLQQWSYFQASGQGPYFGQAAWFNIFHHEPLPSARERYNNEIKRVASVLDTHLANRTWLIPFIAKDAWDPAEYPNFTRWQEAMLARDSLKHVMSVMANEEVKSDGRLGEKSKGEDSS